MLRRVRSIFSLALCVSLASGVAGAQADAAPDAKAIKAKIDEARRAYQAGEQSYQAGDFKTAIENFRDANRLVPTPFAKYWLALSFQSDGQIPQAIAELERLLADPNASKLGDEKLGHAKSTLEALQKTPGRLQLASSPPGASVRVDGEARPGVTPLDLELPPGRHKLSLTLTGHEDLEAEVQIPAGAKGEQTLELVETVQKPVPPAPKRKLGSRSADTPAATPKPAAHHDKTGAWVVAGAAAASAVTGAVFGALALSAKKKYDEQPTSDRADTVERRAMVADLAFASALTLGLGSWVMFTSDDETEGPAPRSASRRHLSVTPLISARGAGASARWAF